MNKKLRYALLTVLVLCAIMNVFAAIHAWHFTHFTTEAVAKTDTKNLSLSDKLKIAITGVKNPRPVNVTVPSRPYQTIKLKSNGKQIDSWLMKIENSKGTVILFHGYTGAKSTMLDKAEVFLDLGYNVLIPDFMGAGESEGSQTTIGYHQAQNVKTCYKYIQQSGEQNIILFGTSMGAVAILRSIHALDVKPKAIIIECPFGTMRQTTEARFGMMHLPSFPMADLLMFWGGLENGFWAYGHNPVDYAKSVTCPTLLMFGAKDDRVSRAEIDAVYENLLGYKELRISPNAGHENYLIQSKHKWTMNVGAFLKSASTGQSMPL